MHGEHYSETLEARRTLANFYSRSGQLVEEEKIRLEILERVSRSYGEDGLLAGSARADLAAFYSRVAEAREEEESGMPVVANRTEHTSKQHIGFSDRFPSVSLFYPIM